MKKLVLLCIMFLSLGASAQQNSYKVRKTYWSTYNRTTGGYDYQDSNYPDGMYITFISKTHFKVNDKNDSEYWTGETVPTPNDDANCTTFMARDDKDEVMGVRACNIDGTRTITVLYPDKYYVIYYLED